MRRGSARVWLVLLCAVLVVGCGGGGGSTKTTSSPAGSSSAPATASSSPDTDLAAHFENSSISVDYPADWTQKDQESGSLFVAPEGVAVVGLQVATWSKTLAKLVKPAEGVEKGGFTSFVLDGTTQVTLDGEPAVELAFHGTLKDGTALRAFAIWSVSNGRAYRFGFKAHTDDFDDLLPIGQAMMESFRIL